MASFCITTDDGLADIAVGRVLFAVIVAVAVLLEAPCADAVTVSVAVVVLADALA